MHFSRNDRTKFDEKEDYFEKNLFWLNEEMWYCTYCNNLIE
jgi:hypothetical protein